MCKIQVSEELEKTIFSPWPLHLFPWLTEYYPVPGFLAIFQFHLLISYLLPGVKAKVVLHPSLSWAESICLIVSLHIANANPKKGNAKEWSNYRKTALILHASKVMLKFSKPAIHEQRTSRCSRWLYKRQRNQRSNCQHPLDHRKSKRVPEKKTSISALLTMPKLLTVWITINCGKFWKIWEYQTTWPASW